LSIDESPSDQPLKYAVPDFPLHTEHGEAPPPANPLFLPIQPLSALTFVQSSKIERSKSPIVREKRKKDAGTLCAAGSAGHPTACWLSPRVFQC
jgi:hypothetical protein